MGNIITSRTKSYRAKPSYGATVNMSHPLANGIKSCWLFNEHGGRNVIDIIGNKSGDFAGPRTSGINGPALSIVDTSASVPSSFFKGGQDFSISTLVFFNNESVDNYVCTWGIPATSGFTLLRDEIDSVTSRTDCFSFLVSTSAVDYRVSSVTNSGKSGIWVHITCVFWNRGDRVRMFINGKEDPNSPTTAGSGEMVVPTTNLIIGNSAATGYLDGKIDHFTFWSRPLNSAEAKSLYDNPYQFIAPRRSIRYITSSGQSVNATVTPSAIVSRFFVPAVTVTATGGASVIITATANKASFVASAVTVTTTKFATVTTTAIKTSFVVGNSTASTAGNVTATATALKSRFVVNSVTVTVTKSATITASITQVRFVPGTVNVTTTKTVTVLATAAQARFIANSASVQVAGAATNLADRILAQSLITKTLFERSRISKRINLASEVDDEKTLLLKSPLH
jgi:hypothetical protein